jgi:hypothetical protein
MKKNIVNSCNLMDGHGSCPQREREYLPGTGINEDLATNPVGWADRQTDEIPSMRSEASLNLVFDNGWHGTNSVHDSICDIVDGFGVSIKGDANSRYRSRATIESMFCVYISLHVGGDALVGGKH